MEEVVVANTELEVKEEPTAPKLGVEESKDVVIFIAKLGVSIAQCVVGHAFKFAYFIDDLAAVPKAIIGIKEIPAEIKDLDSEDSKVLIDAVLTELAPLGITNTEAAKHFIKAGMSFLEGTFEVVNGIKDAKAKL